jgi:hypothetical protein
MNNTQIKNGEVRIFPYYKGEYWGRSEVEFGFSNKSSALKYMKEIPKEDIYDSMGGYEKYYNENAYMLRFNTARLYVFNPRSSFDRRREGGCYDYDLNSEWVYLKDLDNKETIEKDIKDLGFIPDASRNKFKEFEEKYGFFPCVYVDDKQYKKDRKKYIAENVEFREGIVKISVEYIK